MIQLEIQEYNELNENILVLLMTLETQVFESPLSRDIFQRELSTRQHLSILVGSVNQIPCAYKIGFEYQSDHDYFYSWNGGVLQEYRRKGIAKALLVKQHEIAKMKGFKFIRTQTKNKYRSMILLNIQEGFDITGVYKKLRENHHGIILEKAL